MTEPDAVLDAIIARLLADSGAGGVSTLVSGRIYRDVAPTQSATYPLVTVSMMSSDDLLTVNGEHVWSDVQALTKVIDTGNDFTNVVAIASRIFDRLQSYERVTVSGIYITKLRRVSTIPQPSDYVNSRRYLYSNQLWRTEAEPA